MNGNASNSINVDNNKHSYRKLLINASIGLLITAIVVTICYFFVDRPVAFFVYHHHINHHLILKIFTYLPALILIVAIISVVAIIVSLAWRPLSFFTRALLTASVNVMVMIQLKDALKYIFGRTWPLTWTHNNPSLIGNHVYGFFPFHGGLGYASFPSGDATITFAALIVFWLCYPKWRWLYVVLIALNLIGLIGMDYHFVSDVIAGSFLGSVSAIYAVRLTKKH